MKKMKEFFYALLNREMSLETVLKDVNKMKKSKVVKGYIHGMKSIVISRKRRKYAIDPKNIDKNKIKRLQRMIKDKLNNTFLPDFERGYLIAWKDYINYLKKRNLGNQ